MGFFTKRSESTLLLLANLIINSYCLNHMQDMVQHLVNDGEINSEKVIYTMLAVDRKDFCKTDNVEEIYKNKDLPIGHESVISAPSVQITVLEVLERFLKKPNMKVLQLGSGSGYLTVCMGLMLAKGGNITAVDDWPDLVEFAKNNTMKHHADLLTSNTIQYIFVNGTLIEGYLQGSPFDIIHMGFAMETYPDSIIINQLKPGGRFVGPIGVGEEQYMTVIDKDEYGKLVINPLTRVSFRLLHNSEEEVVD